MAAVDPKEFLKTIGTGEVVHVSGDIFSDHLIAVQKVLESYGVDKDVAAAGLLHSIYGTEGFKEFQVSLQKRPDVQKLIGERAEFIAYVNCVMDRASLDAQLDAPSGQHHVKARQDQGGDTIPLTDQQHLDLITVHLGDWLEQVERHAVKTDEGHQWLKVGDAWGYRRRAYRKMAEHVGGKALQHYDEVFAREPEHTRSIHQDLTPQITARNPIVVQ